MTYYLCCHLTKVDFNQIYSHFARLKVFVKSFLKKQHNVLLNLFLKRGLLVLFRKFKESGFLQLLFGWLLLCVHHTDNK